MMNRHTAPPHHEPLAAVEEVELRGHIIDSLILPKALGCIIDNGGEFQIKRITIGKERETRATR